MKKLTALLMIAILVLTFGASVAAATEADIISALQGANVPSVYVSQAQSYLAAHDITAAEADAIIANIEKAKAVANGETNMANLTTSQINQIGTYVNAAAQVLDMKAVLPKDGTVGIYDDTGKLVFAMSKDNAVKQTGYDYSLVLIGLAAVLLAGVTAVAKKVRAH